MTDNLKEAAELLHREHFTCVVHTKTGIVTSTLKGIAPLMNWLEADKELLEGALIADKVIGKAAALLMVYGGVSEVYGEIVSELAVKVFVSFGIPFESVKTVPKIVNRSGDGFCPMETRVISVDEPEQAFFALKEALKQMKA